MKHLPFISCMAATLTALCLVIGCAEETRMKPTTTSSGALKDPFNYKPFADEDSISGGGIGDLDKKALKKDWDHVWLH